MQGAVGPEGLRRRGRRGGSSDTRELILSCARELFAEAGFDSVSMRQIARQAGVDPALVHHYFDSKEDLFTACVALPADPATVLAEVASQSPDQRAEALLRTVLGLWESQARPALLALVKAAVSSPARAALLSQALTRLLMPVLIQGLEGSPEQRRMRGSLVVSQVIGLLMARHVLRVEPLASATMDELVEWVAPTIQRYLTGEL